MELQNAKKASELLKEINELSIYKSIISDRKHHDVAHFELLQHYGNDARNVVFNDRHTPKFLVVVEQIIKELHDELSKL